MRERERERQRLRLRERERKKDREREIEREIEREKESERERVIHYITVCYILLYCVVFNSVIQYSILLYYTIESEILCYVKTKLKTWDCKQNKFTQNIIWFLVSCLLDIIL